MLSLRTDKLLGRSTAPGFKRHGAMRRKPLIWVCVIVLVIASGAGALYAWLVPGLSSARAEPPAAEITVATWLLHQSVPNDAKLAANPLGKDPADITAGRD